jgi:hypothetical protein
MHRNLPVEMRMVSTTRILLSRPRNQLHSIFPPSKVVRAFHRTPRCIPVTCPSSNSRPSLTRTTLRSNNEAVIRCHHKRACRNNTRIRRRGEWLHSHKTDQASLEYRYLTYTQQESLHLARTGTNKTLTFSFGCGCLV